MNNQKYKERMTPIEIELMVQRIKRYILLGAVILGLLFFLSYLYSPNRPVVYSNIEEHFKYGTIGSDIENGLPLEIMQILPRMFPEYLPQGAKQDYTAFGFIQEPRREMPIGFSQRRRIIDLVGLNCAACHVGVVRASETAEPQIYLGMPANTVDIHAFFNFLFACAADHRFTPDNIIAEIEKENYLTPIDRFAYRNAVVQMQAGLLVRKAQLDRFLTPPHPMFGPGRVDTFNPYKVNQFAEYYKGYVFPDEERFGSVDFPSIWNQKIREGMNLHWDGDNSSVRERNFSAAFGAGATRENIDIQAIDRVKDWIEVLSPPPYPFEKSADQNLINQGGQIYKQYCFECHSVGGKYVGQVTPLQEIGTDEHRFNSYTEKLVPIQREWGKGYEWEFKHFRKTDGYANAPLDGIWARAPYLHNGSVPTIYDLLTPAEKRNQGANFFYIGHGVYDMINMGFRTDVGVLNGVQVQKFVITEPGNSNKGHSGYRYGTELSENEKRALIEYLKTL